MSHIYCPECGFQSPEAATYCSRCGALLGRETVDETTMSLGPEELEAASLADNIEGPALVVRSGGGRVGQSFPLTGEKMTIGRSPEAGVFLDDSGSLNGTYVNRQRVDSHRLADGDELQIGKFKLTFFAR